MTMVFAVIRIMETFTAPFYYLIAFFSNHNRIPPTTNPILVTSATILAERIRQRELTCKQVVSAFVQRCKQVNPILNAIIDERYEDALADAEKADQFLASTRLRVSQSQLQSEKPLLGIPITVKECCSIKGMKFSLGVKRYEKRKAAYNGEAVQLLIDAGAIPIAVTSTPAYSSWIETFNELIGYTSNPYDSRKSCGGSSGGEAALITSAASVLGLGSDAGGSIRIPAAFCGIYGHKTSSNAIVSTRGHATFFSQQQLLDMLAVGPLCRYAVDLQLAMDVLSDKKLHHSTMTTTTTDFQQIRIYHSYQYRRIFFAVDSTLKNKILQAVAYFKTKHSCFVKQINVEEFHNIPEITLTHFQKLVTLAIEDNASIRARDGCCDIAKNIFKLAGNSWLKNIWTMDDESYAKQISNLQTKLSDLLGSNGVLLMPTWTESACYRHQAVWKAYNVCYDYFANALDLACTAVPVGLDQNNMPLSIQVVAARNCDHLCLKIAEELEKLFGGWIPPYLDVHT